MLLFKVNIVWNKHNNLKVCKQHQRNERHARTLIITVCWPGEFFNWGSDPLHSGILFRSLIGVPSHLTSGWPFGEVVSLSASGFSGDLSSLTLLLGKPGEELAEKKSVVLALCLTVSSKLDEHASISCFSNSSSLWDMGWITIPADFLQTDNTGPSSSRSWGVKGWVSSSMSKTVDFSLFWESTDGLEVPRKPLSSVIST